MVGSPEIIVVGGGPAAMSVSWPLVEAGIRVLMVDAGQTAFPRPAADRPGLSNLRQDNPQSFDYLLGKDLTGLHDPGDVSPKLRTMGGTAMLADYERLNRLDARNFHIIGALLRGGLSNFWGAVTPAFGERDLAGFPISEAELQPSYNAIATRIGLSGSDSDDFGKFLGDGLPLQPPLPLAGAAEDLFARYLRRRQAVGTRIGLSRNAVLSEPMGDRGACTLDNACMWLCSRGAVYNSADELDDLGRYENFSRRDGILIQKIERGNGRYDLYGLDMRSGTKLTLNAPIVVLAAGTLATTRIVLQFLERWNIDHTLLNTPAAAMALCLPSRFGKALPEQSYGMAQLCFAADLPRENADYAFGCLYGSDAMAAPDLMRHMPLSRRGALTVTRYLLPTMLVGLLYFPGEYSRNRVRLEGRDDPEGGKLVIEGGISEDFHLHLKAVKKRLARDLLKIGALLLPGSVKPYAPGAEVHYGGTLPMGKITTRHCEVADASNLYVVDGAVFNRLPAKQLTFTIMANADRVGRHIAQKYKML